MAIEVRLLLVRIEYVFAAYCEFCVEKPMKERQKAFFLFLLLFFLAFYPLNIS